MKWFRKHKETELIIAIWLLVFASTPAYMYYVQYSLGEPFEWKALYTLWTFDAGFCLLFLVHHYLLIPHCVLRKRIKLYLLGLLVCLGIFVGGLLMMEHRHHREQERKEMARETRKNDGGERKERWKDIPLPPHIMARLTIAILMLGVDLGVVAWWSEQKMRQRLLLLEKQNLKQELEQLRYQINPHFLMNTLNNIHALVDIDKERAQRAIVDLSGLMRHALYKSSTPIVPMKEETEFLQQYISLMGLRYSDKVDICCDLPRSLPPRAGIPPLLLVTFVENAFKHGVSYKQNSYVYIRLRYDEAEGRMHFQCINSRQPQQDTAENEAGGIGLTNVRKRLELICPHRHTLLIDSHNPESFCIDLTIQTTEI